MTSAVISALCSLSTWSGLWERAHLCQLPTQEWCSSPKEANCINKTLSNEVWRWTPVLTWCVVLWLPGVGAKHSCMSITQLQNCIKSLSFFFFFFLLGKIWLNSSIFLGEVLKWTKWQVSIKLGTYCSFHLQSPSEEFRSKVCKASLLLLSHWIPSGQENNGVIHNLPLTVWAL